MDSIDEAILELIEKNARMSFQEIGDAIGMSRVAAQKRVKKLEREGIIRGYNTCICREDDVTMIIDIIAASGKIDDVIEVLCNRTAYIRQIYKTTMENHVHIVIIAVSDQDTNLGYLVKMIKKKCGDDIVKMECHTVKEVVKDDYAGITRGD